MPLVRYGQPGWALANTAGKTYLQATDTFSGASVLLVSLTARTTARTAALPRDGEGFIRNAEVSNARKADNTLMWSHYAESHTGVCLEFDCRIRHFGAAIRVHYYKNYPAHDLSDNDLATALLPWLAKSDAWSYEDEFRIISQNTGANPPPPSGVLVTRNGLPKIPPRALRSVIMGCSIRPDAEAHIRRLVAGRVSPPVVLKRAVRKHDRYELTIEDAS
jgi:Protein of unknown function (DUF2971)